MAYERKLHELVDLDEDRPVPISLVGAGPFALVFKNKTGREVSPADVRAALEKSDLRAVRSVCYGSDSRQRDCGLLACLPNVVRFLTSDNGITDFSELARCRSLRHVQLEWGVSRDADLSPLRGLPLEILEIRLRGEADLELLPTLRNLKELGAFNWPCGDLSVLTQLRLSELRVTSSRLRRIGAALRLRKAMFQSCRRLEDLGGLDVEEVVFDSCPRVRVETLSSPSVHSIRISPMPSAPGWLEGLVQLEGLEHLVLTGRGRVPELRPLARLRGLRAFFCGPAGARTLRDLSRGTDAILTNGDVAWRRGEARDPEEYYDAAEATE